ncbi:hypothetical protein CEV33_1546 [Brucella grignonensis]|uniref:Uncharacterized protein n=1 Tax=Brucella grignonensis TaxID=94627 RepID=A0A256FAV7_9HYPH|nr:hypothetical protein CEV33_1546 [Brucella grignonensis]
MFMPSAEGVPDQTAINSLINLIRNATHGCERESISRSRFHRCFT